MPSIRRYGSNTTKRSNPRKQFPQVRKTVPLSAPARKVITADQRERRLAFDADVALIWKSNIEACEALAKTHNKPIRRCQDAVYLGSKLMSGKHRKISKWKAYLSATVKQINDDRGPGESKVNALHVSKSHREQYHATSEERLQEYVEDLKNTKDERSEGQRVTAKSKVMDIHHTYEELKNILIRLKARVGIKALLFIARDSNEYNQEPLVYATDDQVASFLPKVYMIDMHDFLTKLDGFSISGGALAGMAGTYKQRVKDAKKSITSKFRQILREITGEPDAHMEYKNYHRDIVLRYQIELVGWPHPKLQSPGSLGTSLPLFLTILEALENGDCRFEVLTPEGLDALDIKYKADVAAGIVAGPTKRKKRSDEGQTKKRKEPEHDDSEDSQAEDGGRRQRQKTTSSDHSNTAGSATTAAAEVNSGLTTV